MWNTDEVFNTVTVYTVASSPFQPKRLPTELNSTLHIFTLLRAPSSSWRIHGAINFHICCRGLRSFQLYIGQRWLSQPSRGLEMCVVFAGVAGRHIHRKSSMAAVFHWSKDQYGTTELCVILNDFTYLWCFPQINYGILKFLFQHGERIRVILDCDDSTLAFEKDYEFLGKFVNAWNQYDCPIFTSILATRTKSCVKTNLDLKFLLFCGWNGFLQCLDKSNWQIAGWYCLVISRAVQCWCFFSSRRCFPRFTQDTIVPSHVCRLRKHWDHDGVSGCPIGRLNCHAC